MGNLCNCSKDSDNVLPLPQAQTKLNEQYRKFISFKDFKGFKHIDDLSHTYELSDTLGQGSFGVVKRARHLRANIDCAIKCIKKKEIEKHQILVDLMKNELEVLEKTVRLLILATPEHHAIFELFEDDLHYYIVSELIEGGELYERICKVKVFSEVEGSQILN